MPDKPPIESLTVRVVDLEKAHQRIEAHLAEQDKSIGKLGELASSTHVAVEKVSEQVKDITTTWIGGLNERGVKDVMLEIRDRVRAQKKFRSDTWPLVIGSIAGSLSAAVLGLFAWLLMTALHLKTP